MHIYHSAIALLCFLLLAGCTPPESGPSDQVVRDFVNNNPEPPTLHGGRKIFGGQASERGITQIEHGRQLESDGQCGPMGTPVFPVRITFATRGSSKPNTLVYYFYQNDFGEWSARVD